MTNTKPIRDYRHSREQLMRLSKRELVDRVEKYDRGLALITGRLHYVLAEHDQAIKEEHGSNHWADHNWDQLQTLVGALFFLTDDDHDTIRRREFDYVRSGQYAADEAAKQAWYEAYRADRSAA